MTTTKPKRDYRKQLYESVRISKKAAAKFRKQAKEEGRTMIAVIDRAAGV